MNTSTESVAPIGPAPFPSPIDLHDFQVDEWLVQPTRNRLVKGGTAVRVRPQLLDVLACLARHPGSVVSKDQLLATVWSNRFVAESGIARCVAELRQVLEDDARQPRIIETIPKRGYRLIASVRHGAPAAARAAAPRPAPPVPAAPQLPSSMERIVRTLTPERPLAAAVFALGLFLRQHVRLMVR